MSHKIGKLFLLCSLECYGQHFMSRSLSTKTTVSPARSFWYNKVLDGQFLKLISHWKLNLIIWNFRQLAYWFFYVKVKMLSHKKKHSLVLENSPNLHFEMTGISFIELAIHNCELFALPITIFFYLETDKKK